MAVVEAGLGGRYDATAVVESAVTVLTNVGLEHTRWLGPTVRDIAAEKLAVLRPETTLALGADLDPDALALARVVAAERRAHIVQVSDEEVAAAPLAAFQRRNFALARVAAEAYLASVGIAVDEEAVRGGGAGDGGAGTRPGGGGGPSDGARRGAQPRRGAGAGGVAEGVLQRFGRPAAGEVEWKF